MDESSQQLRELSNGLWLQLHLHGGPLNPYVQELVFPPIKIINFGVYGGQYPN